MTSVGRKAGAFWGPRTACGLGASLQTVTRRVIFDPKVTHRGNQQNWAVVLIISPSPNQLEKCPGSFDCCRIFCVWAGVWQLSERLHLSHAARPFSGSAAFCLSGVSSPHRSLRQYSSIQLADSARQMPPLQSPHFSTLCGCRTPDRLPLCRFL